MNAITIILFVIITYGIGSLFLKDRSVILRLSLGLASIPILGVILNILHIPLDWRIFFGLSLIAPCQQLLKWWKKGRDLPGIKLKCPSWQTLLVFAIFILAIAIYCWGPFQYDWFEDDDPWAHAAGINYISIEKNLNAPDATFQYLNPYPPGYDLLFGILHQINPSIYWVIKFFNGLIICFGFLFFNLFAKEFTKNKNKAALATLFLMLIPCYLTHFIWAHSLAMTLFYPAFFFLLKSLKEKRYILPASICWSAILLTQPTQPIKFAIMAILLILAYTPTKIRLKNLGIIALISASIALIWWGPVIVKSFSGTSQMALRDDTKITNEILDTSYVAKNIFSPTCGSATQAYSWEHFIYIADTNLINNPIGLSPIITLLAAIGLLSIIIKLFKRKNDSLKSYYLTILLWLIFTFFGINSMTFNLPIGLFAFRFWMLFAIPTVLLCTEALFTLKDLLHRKWNRVIVISLCLFATLRVTLPLKWMFNTSEWNYGVHWASDDDINGYVWMRKTLPANTKVFSFTDNVLVIGHNMRADFWTEEYKTKFKNAFEKNIDFLYQNLLKSDYDCLIISPRDIWEYGKGEVNAKLKNLYDDKRFRLIFNNNAVKIFQVIKPVKKKRCRA